MNDQDTIVAVATPHGESAISMLRISGPKCLSLVDNVFKRKSPPRPRRSSHGDYISLSDELLDDVVYCYYQGPSSYTGEDSLEIMCHGNPLIASKVLHDLVGRGCRQADPGEFTQRAFLNGRIDLTQAEAVMELIQARSDKAIRVANNQLRGAFGKQLAVLKDQLLSNVAVIEAYIDFPEEDLPEEQKQAQINGIQKVMTFCSRLIDSSKYAALLRDGVKTLILGEPNAGKSSLLNCLLGFDRAIVSEEPGTTRDFLQERLILGDYSIQLLDTAGLREAEGTIERQGILKTIELAEEADVFLLVVDGSLPCPTLPEEILGKMNSENTIVIRNKEDLPKSEEGYSILSGFSSVSICAKDGNGLEGLRNTLFSLIDSNFSSADDELILINARHSLALNELKECLEQALAKFELDESAELIASDMRGAIDAIGRILGRIDNEDMLDVLFSSFCIGK
ncbi:tRNA uridine-5-carboxymethylaminomethyl(34) synthesis GTPase MnmE [Puniceicoccaceae bacterium K14]|nr:tRNA uridine-5-carboxymethylaminomethyl(34) synthesis GTPase MnmE [Puniceicoccaceae bacterium K14]